jgi:hypothetical protein
MYIYTHIYIYKYEYIYRVKVFEKGSAARAKISNVIIHTEGKPLGYHTTLTIIKNQLLKLPDFEDTFIISEGIYVYIYVCLYIYIYMCICMYLYK